MLKKIWHLAKKILILAIVLALILAVAIGVFVLTFDLNRYKGLAEQKLTLLLQHPVTIESMHTKLATVPTITINGFKIANNEPFQDKSPLLAIKKMDAELELIPLLSSQINIHKVDIDTAELNLYKDKNENNWTMRLGDTTPDTKENTEEKESAAAKTSNKSNSADKHNLRLDQVSVNRLNVVYNDTNKQQNIAVQNLKLKQFHTLDGEIVYNDQTFSFTFNAGTLWDFLAKQPNFPVDLRIKSKLGSVNLNGKIGNFDNFTDLQGTISIQTNDLKTLCNFFDIRNNLIPAKRTDLQIQATGDTSKIDFKSLNLQLNSGKDLSITAQGNCIDPTKNPVLNLNAKVQLLGNDLVELWKIQPMTVDGDFVITPTSFKTKKTVIDANRSDVTLSADLKKAKNNTYDISGSIHSSFLNPDDFIKREGKAVTQQETTTKNTKTATDITIPWDILKTITANLDIKIQHLQVGNWLAGHIGIDTQPSINNDKIQVPFKLSLLDGQVNGELSGQVTQEKLKLSAKATNLNLNGIRALQQEVQNVIVSAQLNLDTKGKTVPHMLKNLNGKTILQANKGQIINKWLASLPKALNIAKKKQAVAFSSTDNQLNLTCAAANFTIHNGVISGKDQFALETNALDVLAGGTINLNQKTMDIVLQPALADLDQANDVLSFSKFVRITGPFNKLTPKVDTAQTSAALLQTGLDKLMNNNSKTPAPSAKTSVCQQVLGSSSSATTKTEAKPQATQQKTTAKTAQEKPASNKNQFQKQLLNTLFETLATP